MYFRWTQLQPLDGQARFYQRTAFAQNGAAMPAAWDHRTSATPTASIAAGSGTSSFAVVLAGLTVGGQTTFPSLQCSP